MKQSFSINTVTKKKVLVTVCFTWLLFFLSHKPVSNPEKKIAVYYRSLLKETADQLSFFKDQINKRTSLSALRRQFSAVRQAYKKMAVLTEYYNPFETKYLNGPALPRTEDDNPAVIIEPRGLQVIEECLFAKDETPDYKKLIGLTGEIATIIKSFQQEPDLDYKFRDQLVFDALQSSLIRIITLGITGFDSPIAQHSLPEAVVSLQSWATILQLYQPLLDKKNPGAFAKMKMLCSGALIFLKPGTSFNSFDRLTFIKKYIQPLYSLFIQSRIKCGFNISDERRPLNPLSISLFDSSAFDIRFFSPNERFVPTPERIELGRQLFYNPVISGTGNRTCATCHQPQKAFTDGLKTALSVDDTSFLLRNTPTLWNSALQTKQFFDSRATKLENQLSDVVHNQEEMKGSLKQSAIQLRDDPQFTVLFEKAYPAEKEKITEYNIANAVSSYIRSLISLNSSFDLYMRGGETAMSKEAKNGFNLFMGKAKCGTCHFMPLFNGLVPPEFTDTESEVLGVPLSNSGPNFVLDTDKGRINYTQSSLHEYAFKTPTLRNIELTAPYMHNGVFATLEEVMEFYNNGGGKGLNIAPSNQTLPFDKLNLTKKEINDIISFMKSLTDKTLN